MSVPSTPRATTFSQTSPVTTPTTNRVAASLIGQSSPHYGTTRRHSLYGIEDRVVIDPGSHIWKVGFSGEGRPRDVFCASGKSGVSLWNLNRAADAIERVEEEKLLQVMLQKCLRSVFHKYGLPSIPLSFDVLSY
jgi:actin-related protein 10